MIGFRVVDGMGTASWVERSDPIFDAMAVSMGLLGIVTKVRLQLNPTFNIYGQEVTTPTTQPSCPIDLFGPGDATRPSMRQFLEDRPYSWVLWWPQKNAERVVIWEAVRRTNAQPQRFAPVPYQEFTSDLGGWILPAILGRVPRQRHSVPLPLGKFIPAYDFRFWADHYRQSLPKFDEFLKIRQARDPDGVFFTRYWREQFTGHA